MSDRFFRVLQHNGFDHGILAGVGVEQQLGQHFRLVGSVVGQNTCSHLAILREVPVLAAKDSFEGRQQMDPHGTQRDHPLPKM
jgi:hypothetical protein